MIAAEAIALHLLRRTVRERSQRLAEALVSDGAKSKAQALRVVGDQADGLQAEFRTAVGQARTSAAHLAAGQVALEAKVSGLGDIATAATSEAAQATNVFEQSRASASMASAWASRAHAQLNAWEQASEGLDRLGPRMRQVGELVDSRVRGHASWQALQAYDEHHENLWHEIEAPEAIEIWSAILDKRTCPKCFALDGAVRPRGQPFPGNARPPVHLLCRCIVVTMVAGAAEFRKLPGIGIDYDELKAEISEHLLKTASRRVIGQRHAADYVREAFQTTSPEALVRRLRRRRYFKVPSAKAPRVDTDDVPRDQRLQVEPLVRRR